MGKTTKKQLIVATFLVVIGIVIFVAVMTAYRWDFSRLGTDKLETNTYEIKEEFSNIKLNVTTADIRFFVSHDNVCKVVCSEQKNAEHSVDVWDNTLTVNETDNRKWYEHIGINLHSPKITVYLPKTEYSSLSVTGSTGDINIPSEIKFENADIFLSTGEVNLFSSVSESAKINTSTGDIKVNKISANSLKLYTSTGEITVFDVSCTGDIKIKTATGDVDVMNVNCQNLISSGSTGDISLKNVISAEKFSIKRSTGDVALESSDSAEIFIKTSTGDVNGSLLTEKIFITETSTGSISVPKTISGGKCEIITSTGDIIFK